MVDLLGWRHKFGVMTPSVNTVVQPEYDSMRPSGVTNHIARMMVPDLKMSGDDDLVKTVQLIDASLETALEQLMTCRPSSLILGISAESIWGGGLEPSRKIAERVRAIAGDIKLCQASAALPAALRALGIKRRIGLFSPYHPVAMPYLEQFWEEVGFEQVRSVSLPATGGVEIAHTTPDELVRALRKLDGDDIEAIVQFGANLPFAQMAAQAETWLGKPVIAVNTATYWHALRTNGINDRLYGFGRILWEA